MSLPFAVVYESDPDFLIATELADRVLCEVIDWLDDDHLPNLRQWIDRAPDQRRLTWKGIPTLARELEIKTHGHFNDGPGEADARAARRAIAAIKRIILMSRQSSSFAIKTINPNG